MMERANNYSPYLASQGIKTEMPRPKISVTMEEQKDEEGVVVIHPGVRNAIQEVINARKTR